MYKLPKGDNNPIIPIDFVERDLPKQKVDQFKKEFSLWVIGCGLREMLEHYAIFLDNIHKYALLVLQTRELLAPGKDPQKLHKNFSGLGIGGKINKLSECFNISVKYRDEISALYQARNCLTHEFGVVSEKRIDPTTRKLRLKWTSILVIGKGEETGYETNIIDLHGKKMEEKTRILFRHQEHERAFAVGDKLNLSHQELWGICYFVWSFCIPDIRESFVKFLKHHKVPLRENP